ncbi:hypothetical protein [Serratia fonticola]|uniref:hypothetical protein n=1 Tax=Serratia fonticola TaxID=47917 RepID=UPI00301CD6F6
MDINSVIDKIVAAGLSVFEHENNCDYSHGTKHITIIGGKRRVEFYPTTGMVYANAVKGEFKAVRLPKSNVKTAIRLAMTGQY